MRILTALATLALFSGPALAVNPGPAARAAARVARAAADDAARVAAKGSDDAARAAAARITKARPAVAAVSDDLARIVSHTDEATAEVISHLGPDAVRAAGASPAAARQWGRLGHEARALSLSADDQARLVAHAQQPGRLTPLLENAHRVGLGAALVAVGIGSGAGVYQVGAGTGQAVKDHPELLDAPARGLGHLFTLIGVGALLFLLALGVVRIRRARPAPPALPPAEDQ